MNGNVKESHNNAFEKVHLHLVKYKSHGKTFEIVVDPDGAIAYRNGKKNDRDELLSILKSDKIFYDPLKGIKATETDLQTVFGTDDTLEIAQKIMLEGEIQLTHEYREQLRAEKVKKILAIIHRNAVDPKTSLPHPVARLEQALAQASVRIDDNASAEDQVETVVKALQPILPIKFATVQLQLHVPASIAHKLYGTVKAGAKIVKESWEEDGSWLGLVELPAGLRVEFVDSLESKSHGGVTVKIVQEK